MNMIARFVSRARAIGSRTMADLYPIASWRRVARPALVALVAGGCLAVTGCSEKDTHPGQPVTKRRAIFHEMLQNFEPMGMMVRDRKPYDKDQFLKYALALQALSSQPWSHFPPGSIYGKSRARPEIWEKEAEFKTYQQKLQDSVNRLVTVAGTGSLDAIRPSYAAVAESCKRCHEAFRK